MAVFQPQYHSTYIGLVEISPPNPRGLTAMFYDPGIAFRSGKRSVNFETFISDDRHLASFADYTLDGVPLATEDGEFTEITPPYIKFEDAVSVERTMDRIIGEPDRADWSPQQREAVLNAREMVRRENRMWNSVELMCATAMQSGTVRLQGINDRTRHQDINLNRAASRSVTLTGTDLWSDAASKPRSRLRTAKAQMQAEGYNPSICIIGANAAEPFFEKDDVQKLTSGQRGLNFPVEYDPVVNPGLTYEFSDSNFDYYTTNGTYIDAVGGAPKNYWDPNGVALVDPVRFAGRVGFGAVIHRQTGNEPIAADMFHHLYETQNGERAMLLSASSPLALPLDKNAVMHLEVL